MKYSILIKLSITIFILVLMFHFPQAQSVIIDAELKTGTMNQENTVDDIVTRHNDQSLTKREASTFIGLPGIQGIPGIDGTDGSQGPQGIAGIGGVSASGQGINITGDGTSGTPYNVSLSDHYIGELYGGGIVYYVYDQGAHGLIASLRDLDGGNGADWGFDNTDIPNADDMIDGAMNTSDIIAAGGLLSEAAGLCDTFSNGGFTDWYLPSDIELKQIEFSVLTINEVLLSDGDPTTLPLATGGLPPAYDIYWSSTETGTSSVFVYFLGSGTAGVFHNKVETYRVRAIRSF